MRKVLITDDVHPSLIKGLEAMGFGCEYQPKIDLAAVRRQIASYHGLVINSKILVDQRLMDSAPLLQFVARLGSGMEIVDQVYAAQKGIHVFRSPEGNCNAVAEHALGMLLALANHFCRSDREVRQMIWRREQNRGFEIMGKTIGIIGFGFTGRSFAEKLSGMGLKVLAYDKYLKGYATDLPHVIETEMDRIFSEADILSFHLPLAEDTRHLVDVAFLQKCKKQVILINTSRGSVIKTRDLIPALKSGKVIGACLDVFENEKPLTFQEAEKKQYQELYQLENVILSPHVAGWTFESKKRLAAVLLEKIGAALSR